MNMVVISLDTTSALVGAGVMFVIWIAYLYGAGFFGKKKGGENK